MLITMEELEDQTRTMRVKDRTRIRSKPLLVLERDSSELKELVDSSTGVLLMGPEGL